MKEEDKELLRNELGNLRGMDHPNILKMYEWFETESHVFMVTELATGGELFDEIIARGKLTEADAQVLLKQVLTCINYCHTRGVMHRDLKPENILLEANKKMSDIKLIDFGFSVKFGPGKNFTKQVGTPYYIAPEVLSYKYGKECDIWSLGVVLFQMMTGLMPFEGTSQDEVFGKIQSGRFSFPADIQLSEELVSLIKGMLIVDSTKRITVDQALQHEWFEKYLKKSEGEDECKA